jgi:alanine racemase
MDAKHSLGEPRALISRAALLHNVGVARRALAPGTRICAIIKADAYGHGANIVADTLCNFSTDAREAPAADMLAVASVDEAASLERCAVPIVIFAPVENVYLGRQREKFEEALAAGWTLTLCSSAAAGDLGRIAMSRGRQALVQVMVDTGMNRAGVPPERLDGVLEAIAAQPALRLAGLCTHFAGSENPRADLTNQQIDRFSRATEAIAARGRVIRHAANSAGVFLHPRSHYDMVRPGISLYGVDPTLAPCMDRPLRPVMKWTAPLVHLGDVVKGTPVGYNQTWVAPADTRIGVIPIGYADGYPRCLGNRAVMMIGGRPAPVVGRVSMDCVTLDLGNLPHCAVGDEVTIMDDDPLSPCGIYALARAAQMIPYEIFCRIGPRVKRVAIESSPVGPLMKSAESEA